MTYDLCTLTDKNFVYKCLALWNSIDRHMPGSRLWVVCLDDESLAIFKELGKVGIQALSIADLEDKGLEATRQGRTRQEFAWTAKPAIMSHLIEKKVHGPLIFVDSDLLFYSSIAPLFSAHPDASVMLTSHKFSPEKAHIADLVGYFNSGFIVFRDDDTSKAALRKWREQCVEWCFAKGDRRGHGDQTYLEAWPREFSNIEEIPEKGVNLGTWNMERYRIVDKGDAFSIDGEPLICYHFHGFITYIGQGGIMRAYPISVHHKKIYDIYLAELRRAYTEIIAIDPSWDQKFAKRLGFLRWIKQEVTRIARAAISQTSQRMTARKAMATS